MTQNAQTTPDPRLPKDTPEQPDAPAERAPGQEEHEGAREDQVNDRGGPGVGYDQEPEQVRDRGGVS